MTRHWRAGLVALSIAAVGAAGWRWRVAAPGVGQAQASGDVDPAVGEYLAELRARAERDAESAIAWRELGFAAEANGLVDAAREAYHRAAAIGEPDGRLLYRLAIVSARAGEVEHAVAAVERAIVLEPDYAPAHWRRGNWLFDLGHMDRAAEAFERALAADPSDPAGAAGLARVRLQQERPADAASILEAMLARVPGHRALLHLLGTAYRLQGRAEAAEPVLAVGGSNDGAWADPWTDALTAYGRGHAARLKQAGLHFLNGRVGLARSELESLRAERPDDLPLLQHLATVHLAAGDGPAAIATLEAAAALAPSNPDTERGLALAWLKCGVRQRALDHARKAVEADPTSGGAHEALGLVLWSLDRRDDAQAAFGRSLAEQPYNPTALASLGRLRLDRGDLEGALDAYSRAARQDPLLADAHVGIARACLALGRRRDAARAVRWVELVSPSAAELPALREALAGRRETRHGLREHRELASLVENPRSPWFCNGLTG